MMKMEILIRNYKDNLIHSNRRLTLEKNRNYNLYKNFAMRPLQYTKYKKRYIYMPVAFFQDIKLH